MDNDSYIPQSALAIYAHPDDIDFSCAGTLARWAKSGTRIGYLVLTSGEVGIAEPGMSKVKAASIREAEQQEAAKIIGAEKVLFLREPDGLLEPSIDLRRKVVREIRQFRPEVIICGDPTVVWSGETYINHPDHRAAATIALDATFPAAGQPNLFQELEQEGLSAHKPRKVYVSGRQEVSQYINVTDTIDLKIGALRAHTSQMKDWDPAPMVKDWAASLAKGKEMRYAEGFRVITLVNDEDWEKTNGRVTDLKPHEAQR